MICRENHAYPPSMAEISDYIHNPLWDTFCAYLEKNYRVKPALAFSKCSWEPGWNIRFPKGNDGHEDDVTAIAVILERC